MYEKSRRIVADVLDNNPPEILGITYAENDAVPEPVREIMTKYIVGDLSREEAISRLAEFQVIIEEFRPGSLLDRISRSE
jgi:hypothetical protein